MKKRKCSMCKEFLNLNRKNFYPAGSKSGFQEYNYACKKCWLGYCKIRELKNPKLGEYRKKYNQRIRMEALEHYSNGSPKCICCGENIIQFLGIDHIDGGGGIHRKQLTKEGLTIYLWLRKNKYPNGFRVLCHNCNLAMGYYGKCPHSKT